MIADPSLPAESEITSVYAYARARLAALLRDPTNRREIALTVGILVALFALPFLSWWRRWTLPASPQGYAVFTLPLALLWLWLFRYRLVLPELDALNERFTENSVLRFLLEEEPEPARRQRWPLIAGGLLTVFALWTGEPSFTCAAFLLLLTGIVGYRFGAQAQRLLRFPLLFLVTMLPLPGLLLDTPLARLQSLLFKIVTHLLQIFGMTADLAAEGNPLQIGPEASRYELYAAFIGTGFAEAGLFLLLTLWFLSLVSAPVRARIAAFAVGVVWIGALLVLRLALLSWVSTQDQELLAALAPLTRWLLPVLGLAGEWVVLRYFRCLRIQEWVAVRGEGKFQSGARGEIALHPASRSFRTGLLRLLAATLVVGLWAEWADAPLNGVSPIPIEMSPIALSPARFESWTRTRVGPPKGDAQRDRSAAANYLYTSDSQPPLYVSVACAGTLNAFRAPWHYLLGPDGMLMSDQEKPIPREGQQLPVRMLQIARDRDDMIVLIHWTQPFGEEPLLDVLDTPSQIARTLLTHIPLYVCDVWTVATADSDGDKLIAAMTRLADQVDARIKAGRRD